MGARLPRPVLTELWDEAVDVHQLRAGHWSRSQSYLHSIGRRSTPARQQCSDLACPAARCLVCREGPDTQEHVLLKCPCLADVRLRLFGDIRMGPSQLSPPFSCWSDRSRHTARRPLDWLTDSSPTVGRRGDEASIFLVQEKRHQSIILFVYK